MARGIQLQFTLNPREFLRGLKLIETDLDDVKEALGDVEEAGDDALDGLDTRDAERGLGRVEDAAEDLRREMDDVGDEAKDAERAFGRFGRGAKSDMDRVERSARDVEDEIGDIEEEAGQSAKEFGAAFRGDPIEALEEVQSYLAEIINKRLPGFSGALATVAAGAAFGAIFFAYEKWQEYQEAVNEAAQGYLDTIREAPALLNEATRAEIARATIADQEAETQLAILRIAAQRGETEEQIVEQALSQQGLSQQILDLEAQRQALVPRITEAMQKGTDEYGLTAEQLEAIDAGLAQQLSDTNRINNALKEERAGFEKAGKAADLLLATNESIANKADEIGEKDFGRKGLQQAEDKADDLDRAVRGVPDIDIKAKVDRREVDNLPTSKTLNVTARVSVAAASARAQRLLDQGVLD